MSNIFKRTEKLSQSIALINELELKQLYHLLQLIVTSSLLTTGSSPEISAQETEFLSSFGENVTSGVKYILEKALYSTLNPEKLNHGLIEMGVCCFLGAACVFLAPNRLRSTALNCILDQLI